MYPLIVCVVTASLTLISCATGVGTQHKEFIDSRGMGIGSVCVVPMYRKVTGVGVGPDAAGSKMLPDAYLIKPYKRSSGENILEGVVDNNRKFVPVPPLVSYGATLSYDRSLLLKSRYRPVLVTREDVFNAAPIVFDEAPMAAVGELIEQILDKNSPQALLQAIFETQSYVRVEYTEADAALLRSCAK